MVLTNQNKQILKAFEKQLRASDRVDIATAWATEGPALDALEAEADNVRIRAIVGLYGNATTPNALDRLGEIARLRLPRADTAMFHPKVYIFRKNKRVTALVGSANLTLRGFAMNTEVICEAKQPLDVSQWFDQRWRECGKLDQSRIDRYRELYQQSPGREPGASRQTAAEGRNLKRIVIDQQGRERPPPRVAVNGRRKPAQGQVTVAGKAHDYDSATTCLKLVLEKLQEQDPSFLERCSHDPRFHRSERTHFVARTVEKLGNQRFQKYAIQMDNDWWLPTQTQTQEKWAVVCAAAEIAGMEVVVEGEHWRAEERAQRQVGF